VPVAFLIEMVAFITGIIAVRRKDHSILVYLSIIIGVLTILFVLLHSLFISD
jgi:ABC-type polysaccharide/polyol phosphate export permease